MPTVALPPVTLFTCQVTAVLLVFCKVAVNCCVAPVFNVAEVGEMEMLITAEVVIVSWADADLVESACEMAVTVTVGGLGTVAGAV